MGKKGVKVLVRTRPTATFSQDQIVIDSGKSTVQVNRRDVKVSDSLPDNQKSSWLFAYDKVLHNAGQDETFRESTEEVVSAVVEGVNGTIMAYGQTGAGKTFTMTGDSQNFKQRGIIPRAIAQVFAEIEERPQHEFTVYASYMEIYNEKIYDLLDDSNSQTDYQVVEDARTKTMQVRGLTMEKVADESEALSVLFRGDQSRVVAEHQLNKSSNRSHAIFTLHVEQKSRIRPDDVLQSKLNLVDLAGSERLKKSLGDGGDSSLQKESTYINKSLTYLEQVVVALTSRARQHVPYRQTKLTNVLKDSLGGNCNTVLIACISGEARHLEETVSTLKLAQRMMRVENLATANQQINPEILIKKYERQIRELKQELLMRDALANRSGVSYDDLSPDECRDIATKCQRFVSASPDEEEEAMIKIESVRQIQECFKQFKTMIQQAQAQVVERSQSNRSNGSSSNSCSNNATQGVRNGRTDSGSFVGEEEGESGFALGEAPGNARPATLEKPGSSSPTSQYGGREGKSSDDDAFPNGEESPKYGSDHGLEAFPSVDEDVPEDRERAFKLFTSHGEGATLYRNVQEANQAIKSVNTEMQTLRREMKGVQSQIEENQQKLNEIHAEAKQDESKAGPEGEVIVDEEEFLIMKEMRNLKKSFRNVREAYDVLRIRKDEEQEKKDTAQSVVLDRFQIWFESANRAREEKGVEDEDILDDGEQFDKLELERVQAEDPDSVAYFKAQKAQKERIRRGQRPTPQSKRV